MKRSYDGGYSEIILINSFLSSTTARQPPTKKRRTRDFLTLSDDDEDIYEFPEDTPVNTTMQVEGKKPYREWFLNLDPEKRQQALDKLLNKRTNELSKKKRKRKVKRKVYRRVAKKGWGGASPGGGRAIVYPNIVGCGPYSLQGDVSWGSPDSYFRGRLGGAISDTVQGLGGYSVRSNSLLSAVDLGQDPPMVRNTNRGEATVINHREYLGDLKSGALSGSHTVFNLRKYALNPGNTELFPFLASIARNFQEYEIRGMLVELKSLSSDFAAQLALGSMFMCADYNVYGNDPTTKQQVENMEYASSAKPSRSMIMPIECDPSNNLGVHKNVAIDSEYHTGDKRLYDWANLYIGTQGCPEANASLAEIWITYEVALFKPIIGANEIIHPIAHWDAAGWRWAGTNETAPMGTVLYPMDGNSPGFSATTVPGSSDGSVPWRTNIVFPTLPNGIEDTFYHITWISSYTSDTLVAVTLPDVIVTGAGNFIQCWPEAGLSAAATSGVSGLSAGESATTMSFVLRRYSPVEPVDSNVTITFEGGNLSAGTQRGLLLITTVPRTLSIPYV